VVLVAVGDDDFIDEIRAVPITDVRRHGGRGAAVPSVDQMHSPLASDFIANRNSVATPCAVNLQEVDLIKVGHGALYCGVIPPFPPIWGRWNPGRNP
jgi:hypothetical protein